MYTALESGGLGAGTLDGLPLRLHLDPRSGGKQMGETRDLGVGGVGRDVGGAGCTLRAYSPLPCD